MPKTVHCTPSAPTDDMQVRRHVGAALAAVDPHPVPLLYHQRFLHQRALTPVQHDLGGYLVQAGLVVEGAQARVVRIGCGVRILEGRVRLHTDCRALRCTTLLTTAMNV